MLHAPCSMLFRIFNLFKNGLNLEILFEAFKAFKTLKAFLK